MDNNKTLSRSHDSSSGSVSGQRIAKNTLILITLRVVIPLVAVALMLVLSRKLGAEGVGRYTLAFSFLYLLNTIGPLGLYPVITREGAQNPDILEKILSNAFTLGTITSLTLTVTMISLGSLLGYDDETRLALSVLSIAILPYTIGNFLEGACVALERTEYIAAATIAEYVLKVGAGIALLYMGYGLQAVLIMAVLGRTLGCLVSATYLRRAGIRARWAWDREMMRKLSGLAPTFVLIAIFATLYWRIDILMLSKLQPMEDVGYYGAAWRLLEFAMVIPTSLCLALYPQIAALISAENCEELARLGETAMRYLFALTLPLAVAISFLGGPVLALLFGESFRNAAITLGVLIWTLVPYSLVRYHAYILVGANRQRIDLLLNILMSAVNIGLNLLLIPRFSHLGAALATFAAICVYATIQYFYVHTYLPGHAAKITIPPIVLIGSAVMGLAIWTLVESSLILTLIIAPVVYFGILLAGRFFSPGELAVVGLDRVLGKTGLPAWLRK